MEAPPVSPHSPSSPSKGGKKRGSILHLPKINSPFGKNKKNHSKKDVMLPDVPGGPPNNTTTNKDETPTVPINDEEEYDSKEIEGCLSDGGVNIKVVVNKSESGEQQEQQTQAKEQKPQKETFELEDNLAHPALRTIHITNVDTQMKIPINAEPVRISNEWFDMDMVIMMRTPNVDDPKEDQGTEWNQKVADHFRDRQRRFEFQFQVKLKKKPVNKELYYAIQWEHPVKMGIIQKACVTACLAFLKRTRPTFHCSINGCAHPKDDGAFEKPHIANFVERGLDRVVVTKPGETPPELGGELVEDLDHYNKRKAGQIKVDFNCEDTYTLALWNTNLDWINWKMVGIPGIKSFDLKSLLGNQSLHMLLYMLDNDRGNHHHYQKDLHTIVNLQLSNEHQHDEKPKRKGLFW